MHDRHPQLRAIDGLPLAIRAANKGCESHLTHIGFRVLVSLYSAVESGQKITKTGLMMRLDRLGNTANKAMTYRLIWRLIKAGWIEQEGPGMGTPIRPSLAGTNYVRAVERYLRNIRWSDY